ncbi:MAG TPA: alcohol dehydrogenase catalytic domain-containing protein [bacterium]|nr:alcohol dehydrogenase catalytic domain-containing protein [bacterium]HPN45751.1 alcohol dehydrogenase catalytic domain-containing protein [bacterium]
MQAAVLTGIRKIALCTIAAPPPLQAHEVLLRVMTAGVCGSDRHYFTAGRIGEQAVTFPFIIGHECAALVEQTGAAVTQLRTGDRVAVDPAVSCGDCDQCRAGRPHTCRNLLFLGCPGQLPGCFAEYIVMPERNCYPLPAHVSYAQGVLAEPLAIAIYALDFMDPRPGQSIAILGAGPIGLCVLAAAQARGMEQIYVTDIVNERIKAAQQAGAVWTGNPHIIDIVQELLHQGVQPDAVFECCGSGEALQQAIQILKPGGKLIIIGIPNEARIAFNIHTLRRKEITIINVRRQNKTTAAAVQLLAQGRVNLDFLLTHRFPLAEAQAALDQVSDYKDGVIKAIIDVNSSR